jgi:hypothetical protein
MTMAIITDFRPVHRPFTSFHRVKILLHISSITSISPTTLQLLPSRPSARAPQCDSV